MFSVKFDPLKKPEIMIDAQFPNRWVEYKIDVVGWMMTTVRTYM